MKLRLHAGSLRLRRSQSEIARLHEVGKVEDAIVFSAGNQLLYAIETDTVPAVAAVFHEANICITLPKPLAEAWIESDQTGIEASTGTLRLLIEKDFQCLHREPQAGKIRSRIPWQAIHKKRKMTDRALTSEIDP